MRDVERRPFTPSGEGQKDMLLGKEAHEHTSSKIIESRYGEGRVREYIDDSFKPPSLSWMGIRLRSGETQIVSDIEYLSPDGRRFGLSTLLPEGFKFLRLPQSLALAKVWRYIVYGEFAQEENISGNDVEQSQLLRKTIPFFKSQTAFFDLFHEIGHAHQHKSWLEDFRDVRLLRQAEKGKLSPSKREKYTQRIIQEERNAWVYALKILRKFRLEGVDLAPELDTTDKLLAKVHRPLHTYELLAITVGQEASELERLYKETLLQNDIAKLVREAIRPKRRTKKKGK